MCCNTGCWGRGGGERTRIQERLKIFTAMVPSEVTINNLIMMDV